MRYSWISGGTHYEVVTGSGAEWLHFLVVLLACIVISGALGAFIANALWRKPGIRAVGVSGIGSAVLFLLFCASGADFSHGGLTSYDVANMIPLYLIAFGSPAMIASALMLNCLRSRHEQKSAKNI